MSLSNALRRHATSPFVAWTVGIGLFGSGLGQNAARQLPIHPFTGTFHLALGAIAITYASTLQARNQDGDST